MCESANSRTSQYPQSINSSSLIGASQFGSTYVTPTKFGRRSASLSSPQVPPPPEPELAQPPPCRPAQSQSLRALRPVEQFRKLFPALLPTQQSSPCRTSLWLPRPTTSINAPTHPASLARPDRPVPAPRSPGRGPPSPIAPTPPSSRESPPPAAVPYLLCHVSR